jgi:hypothetical protein
MKEIKLRVTDEQYEEIARIVRKADNVYKDEIPFQAVVLCAMSKGLGAVEYEIDQANEPEKPRLRIVR